MFFLYSTLFTLGFIVLLPRFVFDAVFNGKYATGFWQRFGFLPVFAADGRRVVWIHAVSVGEANAARQLIDELSTLENTRLIVSTTTRTGQKLAKEIYKDKADAVFYFPFDWKFTVRRALRNFQPSTVLLMETEIWFNFVREANKSGAKVAIVNGRLSQRSFKRYGHIMQFIRRVLTYPEIALMQSNADAKRLMALGMRANKVKVTGNLKFDEQPDPDNALTAELRDRFGLTSDVPLVIAASTHSPEESIVLRAFKAVWKDRAGALPRLMIVPRHPERFDSVTDEIRKSGFSWVRRSEAPSGRDASAEVILLDSIGELRAAYPLADIVFVGGSLIPHGGQSILEPAAAGRAIITGPYTSNFTAAVDSFLEHDALIQLPRAKPSAFVEPLANEIGVLLSDPERRSTLGKNAGDVMIANRGAVAKTIEFLRPVIERGSD